MSVQVLIKNQTAKQPEINAAKVLKFCVFKDTELVVGDQAQLKLPDIYSKELSIGIEVVQMERAEDLDTKYIWNEMEKNNGDFDLTKKFCDEKFPNKYHLEEYNGKVVCFIANGKPHRIDWMKPIYERETNKKLVKLNNGNYSGITNEIDLCISIIYRAKKLYDAKLIAYCYRQIAAKFQKAFNKLYIIESNKLFIIYLDKIKDIKPKIRQNIICDFEITGEDYIEEFEYGSYGTIIQL